MLYSEKMKEILTKFGVDVATLPDSLYSTMLDAISKCDVGGDSVAGITFDKNNVFVNADEILPKWIEIQGNTCKLDVNVDNNVQMVWDGGIAEDLDEYLIPENIRTGVRIFGVKGAFSGESALATLLECNLRRYNDTAVESVESTVLSGTNLESLTIENVTYLCENAFEDCKCLLRATISGPNCRFLTVSASAFLRCSSLENVEMNCPGTIKLKDYIFYDCESLQTLTFRNATKVPTITNSTFENFNSDCVIYVPDDLYDDWIADEKWANYENQIQKLSTKEGD